MTINSWLIGAVFYVSAFVFTHDAAGTYLEHARTPIYLLLAVTLLVLVVNRFVKDSLLEISNLMFVVFFLLRIPFIFSENAFSDVYVRGDNIDAVPHALFVLAYQFAMLSACLLIVRPFTKRIETRSLTNGELRAILTFSGVVLGANVCYLLGFWKLGSSLPSAIAIVFALFTYTSPLFLLAPCLLLIGDSAGRKLRWLLYTELATIAVCVMFTGSKSGVFQIILFYVIAVLAIRGPSYVISARATVFAAIVGLAAGAFFFIGVAFNLYQRGQIQLADVTAVVSRLGGDASIAVAGISSRMGYLDYFIDKLTNDVYAPVFSFSAYVKAVVDAVTPGFDVFHQALVSRAVYVAMFASGEGANSEVITVFAEAQRLVGYLSFLIYIPVILIVRVSARAIRVDFYFARILLAMFVAYAFQQYLGGIGLDYWIFGNVLYPLIFLSAAVAYLSRTGVMDRDITSVPVS